MEDVMQILLNAGKLFTMIYCDPFQQVLQMKYGRFDNTEAVMLIGYVNHPLSSGTIRLRSTKPSDSPLIDPHYLEHPADIKTAINSMSIHFM